jgi:hypothetical protein
LLRKMILLIGSTLILVSCLPGHSQDSPSLGDLARQAQKNKDKDKGRAPTAKVFTNDDIAPAAGLDSLGLGEVGDSKPGSKPVTAAAALADFNRVESALTRFDSMDRPSLVKLSLQGVDTDFQGRSKWEERLFAAKETYVSHGREIIQRVKQLTASAQGIQGASPNDPRVQDVTNKLKEIVQDCNRTEAALEAVVLEGRNLAMQASSH